jgi:NAD(P)-dependent dehydrogenase (short-subunit alcohol dehydrogenase family)
MSQASPIVPPTPDFSQFSQWFSLAGCHALVTGGSRGIGLMIAEGLLRAGATVYISARKATACEATAEALSALGTCIALPADLSQREGVAQLVNQLKAHTSRLDVLVNNAGAAWGEDFDTFPESGWDKVMDTNLKAPFFLTQQLAPLLRESAKTRMAKVINIASVDGISVNPWETYSYHASKSGLIHLTRRLSHRLIEEGIAVNAIAPGAFASSMNKQARDQGDEVARRVPAHRVGQPVDMAAAALYLASQASNYVVGHTLVVDGGVTHARGYGWLP